MTRPSRRNRRPRFNGSPADHAPTQQWLSRLRTDDADGTTWPPPPRAGRFEGRSDLGLMAAPVSGPPPITMAGRQAPWVMTVNPRVPGGPGPTPQALEVVRFLRAKVTILKRRGHADRISAQKVSMVPGDRLTNRRTTAMLIVDEAAELLRCGGEQR